MTTEKIKEYDVVIVGGGPVGLLLAYQLQRFGVTVCVLEQHQKETQDAYGRAIALFPRTSEQLDQLGLIEPMLQLGFACRSSVTYKDGERVIPGRVWTFMENIKDTNYDFTLVLRQMYTEAILREKLASVGAAYHQGTECVDFQYGDGVISTFKDTGGSTFRLKSKYLIGADGGRSFVRRHASIPFDGDTSEDRWIRIDGVVETDMPITRSYGAIESKTHGNVLWAPLDHGAVRIGYAYTPEIAAKYPDGVTQAVAEQEAIESMKPFKVVFKEVHWWTLYTIGQRMARHFSTSLPSIHTSTTNGTNGTTADGEGEKEKEKEEGEDWIFLAGDSAHTHSSGAAQGLNTGIHDAVNLAWKLALVVRNLARPSILKTYESERKTAVQKLLDYDRDIARLMTHKWPEWYEGDREADPYIVLGEIFERAAGFNTGLGIYYPENIINCLPTGGDEEKGGIKAGTRPPDVEVQKPGTYRGVRLQEITPNVARFWVVVFTGAGDGVVTESMQGLRAYLEKDAPGLMAHEAISWLTISTAVSGSPYEALGMDPFGDTYFDTEGKAHEKLGIKDKGAVVVLRPDGLVGATGSIEGGWIRGYFERVLYL